MQLDDIRQYQGNYVYICQQTPTRNYYFIGEVKDVKESSISLVRVKPLNNHLSYLEGAILEAELSNLDRDSKTQITLYPLESIIQVAPLHFTAISPSGLNISR